MTDTTDPQTARYRHRSPEVEAVQWTGSNADQLRAFCGPDFDEIDLDDRVEDPDRTAAVREADHGTWRGLAPGDWVVRLDGGLYEFSAADFAKQYEPSTPSAELARAQAEAHQYRTALQGVARRDAAPSAAVSPPPATDRAGRSERYAAAIHDAMEPDLSLVDQEPGCQALFARAAEAAVALADTEQAGLRRERDLAIAHDRQPYPTAWAYEQACKALRRKTEAIDRVRAVLETEAVVGRSALEYRGLIASALMADEAQQQPGTTAFSPGEGVHGRDPYYAGEEQPRFVRVCVACPECDHTLDENGACANGCHVPPAVVAEPGKENGPAIPCSWAATRYQHSPHDWSPQPGMDPVRCPGWSDEEPTS